MIATNSSNCSAGFLAMAAGTVMLAGAAIAQGSEPPPNYDGRDRNYEISAGSTLRRGDRLTDPLVYTIWVRSSVRGSGSCSAGACPINFNNETVFARRSRLRVLDGSAGYPPPGGFPPQQGGYQPPPGGGGSAGKGSSGEQLPPRPGQAGGYGDGRYPLGRRLQRGDRGEDVRRLQDLLIRDGARIVADGNYGRGTVRAVEDFQRRRRIQVDGVAGGETQRALGA